MSRYENEFGDETLSVGWDQPLNTFFAQVRVNQDEDDLRDLPLKIWIGNESCEITELDAFECILKNEGYILPPNLLSVLRDDQEGLSSSGCNNRSSSSLTTAISPATPIAALLKDGWRAKY